MSGVDQMEDTSEVSQEVWVLPLDLLLTWRLGKYWHDPGAFNNGFKGFCSCFVNAAFAFAGT